MNAYRQVKRCRQTNKLTGRETCRQEERCTVRANPQICRAIEVGKITGIQTYLLTGREMYR
jgi:hypothetical protein